MPGALAHVSCDEHREMLLENLAAGSRQEYKRIHEESMNHESPTDKLDFGEPEKP